MTFEIFKNSCIEKLKLNKFKHGVNFISNFRLLCNDAEINDPEEVKVLIIGSYSNEFFINEFIKRVNDINSVDEIFKIFNDVVLEESEIIESGSSFALKHVATGKYLSSCNISYQTGSKQHVVFAGKKLPDANSLWSLRFRSHCKQKEPYQHNKLFYDDLIHLTHKATGYIICHYNYKSPTTGHREVCCTSQNNYHSFSCINANLVENNNTPYVKTEDIVTLRSSDGFILRSHDFTFTIGNKTFQEVVGHKERIGGNDKWQIKLIG